MTPDGSNPEKTLYAPLGGYDVIAAIGSEPKPGQAVGGWLDMLRNRWAISPEEGWKRVGSGVLEPDPHV